MPGDLFETQSSPAKWQPLAFRIAPKTLSEFVGQQHLVGPAGPLRQVLEGPAILNAIFYGPPGCGKTALAHLIARSKNISSVEFSCVATGVPKIKEAIGAAEIRRQSSGQATLFILDEIHHLNRTQQDVLLPYMENGVIAMIGLTTENPFFYIHRAILSRALTFEFKGLDEVDLRILLERAMGQSKREKPCLEWLPDTKDYLIHYANGDARRLLNAVEFLACAKSDEGIAGPFRLQAQEAAKLLGERPLTYDKNQDSHYNLASAFIKSMRGSDPDATIYWMAKMLEGGEDPRFLARRIVIAASEDVGNADSQALMVAQSAFQAVEMIGLPEAAIVLAHAAIYVACAPKSNACYMALQAARAEVKQGHNRAVPNYLVDSHTVGHKEGYLYPHDYTGHFVRQEYLPQPKSFYKPSDQGLEAKIRERFEFLWKKPLKAA